MALYDPTVMRWQDQPEAKAILAELAKNPPVMETRFKHYVTTRDEWSVYVGPEVDRLTELRSAFGEAILKANQASGDYSAFSTWCDDTIEVVIDGILFADALARPMADHDERRIAIQMEAYPSVWSDDDKREAAIQHLAVRS